MKQNRCIHYHCILYGLTAFLCGAMVMIIEMTGSRMLAPYIGTSLIVWTSLIGVVLASLSFGYWYGGILADRYPSQHLLAKLVFAAGLFAALVGGTHTFILEPISSGTLNLYVASLLATTVLFAVPAALLGMVSPFLARLSLDDIGNTGRTVGRLYALSGIGSILGTFLGGFVLVSWLKTGTIFFTVAIVLILVAFFLQFPKPKVPNRETTAILVLLFAVAGCWYQAFGYSLLPPGIYRESVYNHMRVYEHPVHIHYHGGIVRSYPGRSLQTDPGNYVQATMLVGQPTILNSRYLRLADIAFFYRPDIRNIAVLGGGGYILPRYFLVTRPNVEIDVIEIDPGITAIAREFFELENDPRLQIFHEDARRFFRRTRNDPKKYDFIFGDVSNSSYSIPFHLMTKESVEEISYRLSDDGIYMVNIIASAEGPRQKLFQAYHRTLSEVFPRTKVFMTRDPNCGQDFQNIILVGFKGQRELPDPSTASEAIQRLLNQRWTKPIPKTVPPLLDALAPVEWYLF